MLHESETEDEKQNVGSSLFSKSNKNNKAWENKEMEFNLYSEKKKSDSRVDFRKKRMNS